MAELNMQELASAVLAWMRYEGLCGRSRLLIEETLRYPIYGYVSGQPDLEVDIEAPFPRDVGADRKRVDYVFFPGRGNRVSRLEAEAMAYMEAKCINLTEGNAAADLVRLLELPKRRYFLYAQYDSIAASKELLPPMFGVPTPERSGLTDSQRMAEIARVAASEPYFVRRDNPTDWGFIERAYADWLGRLRETRTPKDEFWTRLVGYDQHPLLAPTTMVAIWEVGCAP
ncbi:MAG: hypothetical protein R6X13_02375 [bacterium]